MDAAAVLGAAAPVGVSTTGTRVAAGIGSIVY